MFSQEVLFFKEIQACIEYKDYVRWHWNDRISSAHAFKIIDTEIKNCWLRFSEKQITLKDTVIQAAYENSLMSQQNGLAV